MTPRFLNFIPISCMGPRYSPKDTHVILQPTLVHWSMYLQYKFELCTLNAQILNQCIKRPNEQGITPKFSTILLFGLICLCKKIKAGEDSVRMSFRTRRWHVASRNHEPSWEKLCFARSLHQSLSQFVQNIYRSMLAHVMTPSQVSWFSSVFWIYMD